MKIITKQIEAAFAKQGYTGEMEPKDIKIIMKLFYPAGASTWYLYEKENDDIYWAYVTLGNSQMAECGTVSMSELMDFRGQYGLGIERDKFFKPFSMSLQEVIDIIESGGHV
jgi:hypothetical protein